MKRSIPILALTTLLAGCVSYSEYGSYDDGHYVAGRDAYGDPIYADGSSYYSPSNGGSGDYYYQDSGYSNYGYSSYVDSPYYYSLFWSLNRWSVDPYWHPQFFYGVTYYPRNYFSFGYSGGYNYGYGYGSHYRPFGYGSYAYSPYRHSWVDDYYDWSSYHHHYTPSYNYYAPRYGNARNESAWLSRQSYYNAGNGYDGGRYDGRGGGLPRTQASRYEDRSQGAVIDRRQAQRGADYGGRSGQRADPAVRGFGYDRDADVKRPDVRGEQAGAGRGERNLESRGEFNRYRQANEGVAAPRARYLGESGDVRSSQVGSGQPSRYTRSGEPQPTRSQRYGTADERGYAPRARASAEDAGGYRIAPSRSSTYARPVQQAPVREAPVYRESSSRYNQGADYQPRQSRPTENYQRQPQREQSAPQYRSEAPSRESYSPRESRYSEPRARESYSQPSYSQPSSNQPSYRESAPQRYEAPARMESRGGDYGGGESRGESRSESRAESRSESAESPRSREGDEQAPL